MLIKRCHRSVFFMVECWPLVFADSENCGQPKVLLWKPLFNSAFLESTSATIKVMQSLIYFETYIYYSAFILLWHYIEKGFIHLWHTSISLKRINNGFLKLFNHKNKLNNIKQNKINKRSNWHKVSKQENYLNNLYIYFTQFYFLKTD